MAVWYGLQIVSQYTINVTIFFLKKLFINARTAQQNQIPHLRPNILSIKHRYCRENCYVP